MIALQSLTMAHSKQQVSEYECLVSRLRRPSVVSYQLEDEDHPDLGRLQSRATDLAQIS